MEQIAALERKLKDPALLRNILKKKSTRHFLQKRSMIYILIRNYEKIFVIKKRCKVVQVE
jgi:hypothetical protein